MIVPRMLDALDDRLGTNRFTRRALDKVFPDHWSFLLGELTMYCLMLLIATGTYLTLFFRASAKEVTYNGRYAPLRGLKMSEAYESTIRLSFDVRAGLLIRQIHHWAALLFLAAIVAHLCRIFFTGAFRKPRELNWLVGLSMLILGIVNGFSGYSLPDDLLSGTGLRIANSLTLGIPVIGTWVAFSVFGGEFPDPALLSRLYVLHVLLVPGVLLALIGGHLAMIWHQKHTQFPGPGRTEENVVGSRLWPTYTFRSLGLFAAVTAVCSLLGGLVQINPIWLYGPSDPAAVSTAAQPDWYMGWLEGAFRLMPPFRPSVFGYPIAEVFWPGVVLPSVTFSLLYAWPFLERRFTGDRSHHELLDRPRDHPVRTALGVTTLSFYIVLLIAGSQDLIAQGLTASLTSVTTALRITLLAVPLLVGVVTWKACHDLSAREDLEERKHRIRNPEPPDQPGPAPAPNRPVRSAGVVNALWAAIIDALIWLARGVRHRS